MRRLIFRVFGARVMWLFGGLCMVSVAVLAAMYLSTGYGLRAYVNDQVDRLPWDIAILQGGELGSYQKLRDRFAAIEGVERVEALGMLRIQRGSGVIGLEADGAPLPARWVTIIGTTDPQLLPPELRGTDSQVPAVGVPAAPAPATHGHAEDHAHDHVHKHAHAHEHEHDEEPADTTPTISVQAALITSGGTSADPSRIDAGSILRLFPVVTAEDRAAYGHHAHQEGGEVAEHHHDESTTVSLGHGIPRTLLRAVIANPPTQIERLEFNKWMLSKVGSLSYLPEQGIVIAVPMQTFNEMSPHFEKLFLTSEGIHGGEAAPPYLPEVAHIVRLNRSQWVSAWDLGGSLQRLTPLLRRVLEQSREVTPFTHVNSDLNTVLTRMYEVSQLVGFVSLLVAIPLLWLAWVVAKMSSRLLLLNERRLIGLAIVRGIPMRLISQTIMLALIGGGVLGGIVGLAAGLGLPVLAYGLAGEPPPPAAVFLGGLKFFPVFLLIGTVLAVLSGVGMIREMKRMTPREAITRVNSNEDGSQQERLSVWFKLASSVALIVGGYKIGCWIAGHSLLMPLLEQPAARQWLSVAEGLLNFLAVPLFLAGIIGILRWQLRWFQQLLNVLTAPIVGRLHWFVAEHMALGRQRIAGVLFLTALAMSMTLLPQVAADTFYSRLLRGVDSSIGGDLQLEFSLTELAGGMDTPAPLAQYRERTREPLAGIERQLRARADVEQVSQLQQFVIPGFYLPTQSGLLLNLVEDPEQYERTVYFEDSLGLTRPLPQIIEDLSGASLTASRGLLSARRVPLQQDILFGYVNDYEPVSAQLKDVVAFLPGQPSIDVSQREGYAAAELDYLNYVMGSDARVISSLQRFGEGALGTLHLVPSRAVFLLKMRGALDQPRVDAMVAQLPLRPYAVRWAGPEREKVGRDMFVSLALENMKVFMIGGLVLALAGVLIMGLANFISERRTFSLLRLRGVPFGYLLRISLALFLVPVLVGLLLGVALGAVSGYGIAQAIWELPRVYGVAGFLENRLVFSALAGVIGVVFAAILTAVALGFAVWPLRKTAREAMKEG